MHPIRWPTGFSKRIFLITHMPHSHVASPNLGSTFTSAAWLYLFESDREMDWIYWIPSQFLRQIRPYGGFPLTKHTFLPTKNISMISRRRGLYEVHLFVRAHGVSLVFRFWKPLWIQLGTPPYPVTHRNQDFSYFRMIPFIVGDKLVLTETLATETWILHSKIRSFN